MTRFFTNLLWNRKTAQQTRHRRQTLRRLIIESLENRLPYAADLVSDINTIPENSGSSPQSIVEVNGIIYFTANTLRFGRELWKSDGTAAGTVMVRDIRSGSYSSSPRYLTNANGTLYFSANDGTGGYELWKSDGTAAGTVMVRDIRSGSYSSYPTNLTNANGTLYFLANDGTNGYELWKSDGTTAGTVMVRDILSASLSSVPRNLTNVNGTLYFSATSTHGIELWRWGNEAPADIMPSSTSIAENAGVGAPVGFLFTSDPDLEDIHTYTLVAGGGDTDNAAYNIVGNSLHVTTSFDFETKSSYSIRVRSTDQDGLWFEKPFTISVTNVNEAPELTRSLRPEWQRPHNVHQLRNMVRSGGESGDSLCIVRDRDQERQWYLGLVVRPKPSLLQSTCDHHRKR